jgi:hypothetical protein
MSDAESMSGLEFKNINNSKKVKQVGKDSGKNQ